MAEVVAIDTEGCLNANSPTWTPDGGSTDLPVTEGGPGDSGMGDLGEDE